MSRPPSAADRSDAGMVLPVLEPGTRFADRYEIIRRLGVGGMGSVHLARHSDMGRLCAIKLLHPRLGRDREALDRFTREARSASRILHPNICAIYDFGSTPEGLLYLVMEYVEGRPLGAILAETGTLPLRRTVHLTQQIAAGLDAAHELGIVHRDLKPDNVMVTEARGRETVKLVDFGIAKAADPGQAPGVTATGVVVGTPDYMAPEQFAGDPVDHRADVYSLGLCVYRMLAGTLPFRAATARESLARRLAEPPEPLAAANRRIPAGIDQAVRRALARDPDDRYPTAGALASALADAIAELPPDPEDAVPTVRLDAETTRLSGWVAATRSWPAGRKAGAGLVGLGALTAAIVLVLQAGNGPEPVAGPPAGQEEAGSPDNSGGTVLSPAAGPESTAPTPPPAPGVRPPPLTLPTVEEIVDPETRSASRTRAEQIYFAAPDQPVRRAEAAFLVANAYLEDSLFAQAESWSRRAVDAIRRARPDSLVRARLSNYETLLRLVQAKLKEPPRP